MFKKALCYTKRKLHAERSYSRHSNNIMVQLMCHVHFLKTSLTCNLDFENLTCNEVVGSALNLFNLAGDFCSIIGRLLHTEHP